MTLDEIVAEKAKRRAANAAVWHYLQLGVRSRKIIRYIERDFGLSFSRSAISDIKNGPPPDLKLQAPGIKSNKKRGKFSWREWVPQLTKMQELRSKGSFSQDEAFIELGDGTRPVAVVTFSDQHMGAWSTNYRSLVRFTDEILSLKDLYIVLLGDIGQYAIKLRNVLEVSDNLLPPEQQTQFIEDWLDEMQHKIVASVWDNHGVERQESQAGESTLKRILSRRVTYFNGIGHLDIKVGKQIYKVAASHKFRGRSMLNPVHALMRYMRFEGIDREMAMMGDSHVPGLAKYTDGPQVRVALNSGSLQDNSGYAKRYFSLKTHEVFPLVVLHPDRHEITPYWSVKEWLESRS